MIKENSLQFGITREDPLLEEEIIRENNLSNILLICSGGDTILHLKSSLPSLKITTFDFNPLQLEHFKTKKNELSVGNFESLFSQWKKFFNEFIIGEENTLNIFKDNVSFPKEVFNSKWWPVSFDLHFHDSFLLAMFGEAAIQHAPKGSYPRYFQKVFERGLTDKNFSKNPFLQHILLGHYLNTPKFFEDRPSIEDVRVVEGDLSRVGDLSSFDLIQLSNIFDWSSLEEIKATSKTLNEQMKKGSFLLLRQINNEAPVKEILGSGFEFFPEKEKELYSKDRSLFYSNIILARKLS